MLDRFSLGHAAVGVLYGAFELPWWAAAGLAVGWEIIENPLKDWLPEVFPDACYDSLPNAVADAVLVIGGYVGARYALRRRA